MKKTDVLILGGGLAGLGCAHELTKSGFVDFLLLTKEVGGRAPDSAKTVPRATFYARTEYKNLWPYLRLGRKADVLQGRLVAADKIWTPRRILLKHPFAGLRFYLSIRKFNNHYERFSKRSEKVSQKQAFEEDSYLYDLYRKSAVDFLKENNLSILQEELIGTLVRVTRFITIEEASAFLMLWIWLILVKNGRECTIDFKKMTEGFSDRIICDEAISVKKADGRWSVQSIAGETYLAKTLVVATPIDISKRLLDIGLPDPQVTAVYSCIIKGKPRQRYNHGRYNVLPSHEKDVVIVRNDDETYMFCSTKSDYDLSIYFEEFEIVETKSWNPAGFFGRTLIEAKQTENLYLIGDYHFPGLEAAFVTGIQVARSIVFQVRA